MSLSSPKDIHMLASALTAPRKTSTDFPPPASPRLVIVEEYPEISDAVEMSPLRHELQIFRAASGPAGLEMIRRVRPGVAVVDLDAPQLAGVEILDRILESDPAIQVVLVSSDHSTARAVEAMRRGACDYLTKPVSPSALISRMGDLVGELSDDRQPEHGIAESERFGEMVGGGAAMRDVYARLRRLGPNCRTALVTGATGTGKELAAKSLHALSPVSHRPFIVCNCAAIAETLFESEMFGHAKGAFTGAVQDRPGLFEAADGGTIFLDEIGEIPMHLQSKLLRVLQNNELQRVGSRSMRKVDIRVIAATNRDLRDMSRKGTFREDLFFRLSMLEVKLPSLADRREDIPLLRKYFLDQFSLQYGKRVKGFTRRADVLLSRYGWPGNVRELQNVMGHACLMTNGDLIDITDLPEYLNSREVVQEQRGHLTLEEVERRHVHSVLAQVDGNKLEAAEILGISRATIYRILAEKES